LESIFSSTRFDFVFDRIKLFGREIFELSDGVFWRKSLSLAFLGVTSLRDMMFFPVRNHEKWEKIKGNKLGGIVSMSLDFSFIFPSSTETD
jgi:hypothetical protein